jgi:hypothetical protein
MLIKYDQQSYQDIRDTLTKLESILAATKAFNAKPNSVKADHLKGNYQDALLKLESHCQDVGLIDSAKTIEDITDSVREADLEILQSNVSLILKQINRQLEERIFFVLSPRNSSLYKASFPFGENVALKFPSAYFDTLEATKCLATGRYTSCVFHLMRTLESGLRVFADNLDITDFGLENWKVITDQIEKKLKLLEETLPKSQEKSDLLQFANEAAKEFSHFRIAWRNHVSHSRASYVEEEALKIYDHVKDFMIHLSTQLKEKDA